ncbi:metallophosphoesterase [uncultured Nocardioides sp.]|uniref:metallophosphoesterase n=1 Tax=uncultured Nocardioides sp. TaxID=198441 RepID=UPI002621347B|nr:metallophosphoesterase [uncultured Nocardioides sp.]
MTPTQPPGGPGTEGDTADGGAAPPDGAPARPRRTLLHHTGRGLHGLALLGAWAGLAVLAGLTLFLGSSRELTLASHDAVVQPTLSRHVVVRTGPVLPDLRLDSGAPLGVAITLGKTDASSTEELVDRYAVIASSPEGAQARVQEAVVDMAARAALRGAAVGAVPVLVWVLVGSARRRELLRGVPTRRGAVAVTAVVAVGVAWWQPWTPDVDSVDDDRTWITLEEFLGDDVPVPEELVGVEVRGDVTTNQTRRLVESAVNTYEKSRGFYADAAEEAGALELRMPEEDETVVVFVSDRHDNIGMDRVARAVGDRVGATAVFDGGDDTSTGSTWEAFSLDSVSAAFEGYDRFGVAGNHDNGDFVADYLAEHGWTMLDGEVVEGPGGGTLLGVADPRSSGLGSWRDETGLSFEEVGGRLADVACEAAEDGEPIGTVLVHDANLATETLTRGCADLVLGGHLHVEDGPEAITGPEGQVGYRYTMGTTGGAAYAFALGSKPRRVAQITLVTYREGRPVGLQAVFLQTNRRWDLGDYTELIRPDGATPDVELPTPSQRPDSGPATGPSRPGSPPDPGDDID